MPESVLSATGAACYSRLRSKTSWSPLLQFPQTGFAVSMLLWLTAGASVAWAHPDLDEQVAVLTAQIEQEPGNAELLLRRSEVHRWHGEFALALADVDSAARLQPSWKKIALARALTLDAAGEERKALAAVQEFLKQEPAHAGGLVLRGRCYCKLGQPARAVADYSAALTAFAEPSPDLFVERARLQASLGHLDEAVRGLDEGVTRLGPVPALQRLAIDYERQQGQFDQALKRVDRLVAAARLKEPFLLLRAQVLEQAGRLADARDAYRQLTEGSSESISGPIGKAWRVRQQARDGLARVEQKQARLLTGGPISSSASTTTQSP